VLAVKRRFRLTRTTDFLRVRQLGKSYAHPLIVLVALPGQQDISRFGVIASRTIGKAVQRNRAKRLMRAAVQSLLPEIKPGWDIVLIARRSLPGAALMQTQAALAALLRRANLLRPANLLQHSHDE